MADADSLVEEIRRDLEILERKILEHAYVRALEEGRIPRDKLCLFVGEQYTIIGSDLRSVAHLVTRFGAHSSRDFFLSVLQGEKAARDALLILARAIGMGEESLRLYEPLPGAQAYTCYMAWLALYASDAEIAAAYLVNFPAWGRNCGRLSRILKERYGFTPDETAFFDLFATPPPTFEADALAVIQSGLDRGVDPRLVSRAARLLQAYELMFWDTLYASSVPA